MADLSGSCACGQVRYTATGDPRFTIICQCRACQKMTGSTHGAQFGHSAAAFLVDGEMSVWSRDSAAGYTVRQMFCPTCGTTVYGTTTRMEDVVMVQAGTLDDPAAITPTLLVYSEERIPWDHATVELTE